MWIFRSSHKHIGQDTLSEYLDGRLLGRPLARVEQQLADCDACRQGLAELRALVAMMQQLPMPKPRRSFVMSAPPPELVRARPALPLRAPNWVYAGAASVAALALAITISVDATGGLTSDPLRQDVVTTATAPSAASEPETGSLGPPSEPGPAVEAAAAAELAARFGTGATPEITSTSGEDAAPPPMAAAAPEAATTQQLVREEPDGGQAAVSSFGADTTAGPFATSAPVVKMTTASQDEEASATESASVPEAVPVPEVDSASEDGVSRGVASETGPAGPTGAVGPASSSPEPFEPAVPDLVTEIMGGGTSTWWRLLEVAAGTLAVLSVAVLAYRWRSGRRDFP
jgi:hypothetical protein